MRPVGAHVPVKLVCGIKI